MFVVVRFGVEITRQTLKWNYERMGPEYMLPPPGDFWVNRSKYLFIRANFQALGKAPA